jgi:hypothetical protein
LRVPFRSRQTLRAAPESHPQSNHERRPDYCPPGRGHRRDVPDRRPIDGQHAGGPSASSLRGWFRWGYGRNCKDHRGVRWRGQNESGPTVIPIMLGAVMPSGTTPKQDSCRHSPTRRTERVAGMPRCPTLCEPHPEKRSLRESGAVYVKAFLRFSLFLSPRQAFQWRNYLAPRTACFCLRHRCRRRPGDI